MEINNTSQHKSLTIITPLSKILAAVLFITLPFVGFCLGMGYEKATISVLTESTIPTVNITPKLTADLTANWKTYMSRDYGYLVKYPKDWVITEAVPSANYEFEVGEQVWSGSILNESELQKVSFQKPPINSKIISHFQIIVQNTNQTLDKIARMYCCIRSPDPSEHLPVEDINLSGMSARKIVVTEFGYDKIVVVTIKDNLQYSIISYFYFEKDDPEKEKYYELFNQILSTFKFIE